LGQAVVADLAADTVDLRWPAGFFRVEPGPRGNRYLQYLQDRGFQDPIEVSRRYRLRSALEGPFSWRIVLPLYEEGRLVGWTGRAIDRRAEIRYRTHPEDGTVQDRVFNYDKASKGGRLLVLCEGPFDALKVDVYGRALRARAVAVLGLQLTEGKIERVRRLSQSFDRVAIMLDREAYGRSSRFASQLAAAVGRRPILLRLPEDRKDPGELSKIEVRRILRGK
jgi:DNA primase